MAFSALNSTMGIAGDAYVRVDADIRVSGINLTGVENNALELYSPSYSKNTIKTGIRLDSLDSVVNYKFIVSYYDEEEKVGFELEVDEKIEIIKRIYIVGIIAYIVISIMSQNGSEFNTKKIWIVIKNGIKLMLWWGLIIGALFILTIYHIFFPSSSLGLRDELEINEIKIPTLYKYTKHDDVFFSVSLQNIPEEDKMDFIIVSYKDRIPLEKINMYKDALESLGYSAELIEGTETYFYEVPDKSSYICIIINGAQKFIIIALKTTINLNLVFKCNEHLIISNY